MTSLTSRSIPLPALAPTTVLSTLRSFPPILTTTPLPALFVSKISTPLSLVNLPFDYSKLHHFIPVTPNITQVYSTGEYSCFRAIKNSVHVDIYVTLYVSAFGLCSNKNYTSVTSTTHSVFLNGCVTHRASSTICSVLDSISDRSVYRECEFIRLIYDVCANRVRLPPSYTYLNIVYFTYS